MLRRLLQIALLVLFIGRVDAQTMDTIAVVDTVWHPAITADTLRLPLNFDEQLLIDINALGHDTLPTLDFTMAAFTHSIYVTLIAVPGTLYGLGWAFDDHHMAVTGMNTMLSTMTAGLTSTIVKAIVRRSRPYATLRGVRIPTGQEIGYSFPSGHSSTTWALSTALMLGYPKWYVIAPAILYASAVSISRPYVGVHYPTDILAGVVVGVGSALLIHALEDGITKNFPSLFPEKKPDEILTTQIAVIRIPF